MTTSARFDLKLDPADKDLLARASTLTGTTMAGFVRAAARARAQEVIDRETRLNMSQRDLVALSAALEKGIRAQSGPEGSHRRRAPARETCLKNSGWTGLSMIAPTLIAASRRSMNTCPDMPGRTVGATFPRSTFL